MGIAALGIALAYLLAVAAGAVGALLVLVRLFGEAPGGGARTGHEPVGGLRGTDRFGAGSTHSASVGRGRSEDEAA